MFANIEFHAGVKREDDEFAGSVAREGDAARASGDANEKRHTAEDALQAAGERHDGEWDLRIFPQHDVVFEEDGVARARD